MTNELIELTIDEWVMKVYQPAGEGPFPVVLLLHGWTGDENSMWVFGSQLPNEYMMIAPRAPYFSNHPKYEGYSWVEKRSGEWACLDDFTSSIESLDKLLNNLANQLPGDFSVINIAGFSQGAAMSYAYSLRHPDRVKKIVGLAGFVPDKSEEIAAAKPLTGKPVFIAHGTNDHIVPIAKAVEAKVLMLMAGGVVTYCESDVGHKLGANCFRGIKEFMPLDSL
ncbi:MAG: alpha/beta fold hydrolase [Chloroflexota bacterium]